MSKDKAEEFKAKLKALMEEYDISINAEIEYDLAIIEIWCGMDLIIDKPVINSSDL